MSSFTVSGRWQTSDGWQSFETEVDAENEDVAVERAYATIGSRHGRTRPQIEISEVEQ